MKVKTSELSGVALDWAVAKCEEHEFESLRGCAVWYWLKCSLTGALEVVEVFKPSVDWAQGGPIIEREAITLDYDAHDIDKLWEARRYAFDGTLLHNEYGPTPLIAAMRCYVASEMGDVVSVPGKIL